MPNTFMLVTDYRWFFFIKKKKKTALAALFENVSLYFSFLFVLLSNNIAQLQRQSLAVQISAGFFCCVVAYSREKKCRNSVLFSRLSRSFHSFFQEGKAR